MPVDWISSMPEGLKNEPEALAQIDMIASSPIFTVEQILDDDFFPGD